jgi:hypothetical protein
MLTKQRKILNDELTRCKIQLSFFFFFGRFQVKCEERQDKAGRFFKSFNLFKIALDDKRGLGSGRQGWKMIFFVNFHEKFNFTWISKQND